MAAALRIYTYVMAFAGLLAVLVALSGLLAIFVAALTLGASTLLGASVTRTQVSLDLAALIVGLPVWLGHWLIAERRAARIPEERETWQRRLFLAAVFATTSVVALFALQGLLRFLLTLPGTGTVEMSRLRGIENGARLLFYGGAWLTFARLGARRDFGSRPNGAGDVFHAIAVFALCGVSLALFLVGVEQALRQLTLNVLHFVTGAQMVILSDNGVDIWTVWSSIAASLLAGGAVWAAIWQHDLGSGGYRRLRVAYLYIVLLIAAPASLGSATYLLTEFFRRLFGNHPPVDTWAFLPNWLPIALVGGTVWVYHWAVLRRQAIHAPVEASGSAIPWPRRPGLALLALLGLAMAVPAFTSLLWLGLDFLFNRGTLLSGSNWWRDRLSAGLAVAVVGTGAWLGSWSVLQRAATIDAAGEGASTARRALLGSVILASALAAIGFTIALLWLGFRALLGDVLSPSAVSLALKELSALLVVSALGTSHALVLRQDLSLTRKAAHPSVRLLTLLTPGAESALAVLSADPGVHVELLGRLIDDGNNPEMDIATLRTRITASKAGEGSSLALLILHPEGGKLYQIRSSGPLLTRVDGEERRTLPAADSSRP
ncbi:MAG: DUF5671 domain-containing protein [Chloroflexi bacterium]|nr:DUF5671 domain-containing protein [Chloroflexota bacterium]